MDRNIVLHQVFVLSHLEHLVVYRIRLLLRRIYIRSTLHPWLLRLRLRLILSHLDELTSKRLITFFLEVLGPLSSFYFVFI